MTVGRDGEFYREALALLVQAEQEDVRRKQEEAPKRENDDLAQLQVEAAARPLPRDALKSGGLGPQMVTIASGRFRYLPYQERRRHVQWVNFDNPFAISKYEVTRGEYARFVKATRYRTDAEKGGRCTSHSST